MNYGLSDRVREVATEELVKPAKRSRATTLSIAVRDLMTMLRKEGFPASNWSQICTAIQSGKFQREAGLVIERVEGPPSRQGPNVVVHYKVVGYEKEPPSAMISTAQPAGEETPDQRAHRLTGRLFGLLKEEIAAMGGAEAFIQWVRSEEKDRADENAA